MKPPRRRRRRAEKGPPNGPILPGRRGTAMPAQEILDNLSALRTKLMARLRSLNDFDFQRTGIHSKFGEMTLSLWVEFFLVHEGHHLNVVLGQRKIWHLEP